MTEQCMVRIVPADSCGAGPKSTQGTKVMVGNVELRGITRIELIAEVNNVWRARIDCLALPPEIEALAQVSTAKRKHWLLRLLGVR